MPTTDERALAHLVVPADLERLVDVRAWVRRRALPGEFSDRDLADIELAVTEAVSNVIRHAYGEDSQRMVNIRAGLDGGRFLVRILDTGPPFLGATGRSEPDAPRAGGYGLGLISTVMDDATWTRLPDGRNELRLMRRCPGARA